MRRIPFAIKQDNRDVAAIAENILNEALPNLGAASVVKSFHGSAGYGLNLTVRLPEGDYSITLEPLTDQVATTRLRTSTLI